MSRERPQTGGAAAASEAQADGRAAEREISGNGGQPAGDTLSVTDNRTGATYELAVSDGTLRAVDLRQIKVDERDFGLIDLDLAQVDRAQRAVAHGQLVRRAGAVVGDAERVAGRLSAVARDLALGRPAVGLCLAGGGGASGLWPLAAHQTAISSGSGAGARRRCARADASPSGGRHAGPAGAGAGAVAGDGGDGAGASAGRSRRPPR